MKWSTVSNGTRIYGTRFFDAFKIVDNKPKFKPRLAAENYRDNDSTKLSTKSRIIQRSSQLIICCMVESFKNHKPYHRDMPEAYIQSRSSLERHIYLEAPAKLELTNDEVILV